jgi:hypothetical protein
VYFASSRSLYQVVSVNALPSQVVFPVDLPHLKVLSVAKPFIRNLNNVFSSCPKLNSVTFYFNENSAWKGIVPAKLNLATNLRLLTMTWVDTSALEMILPSDFDRVSALRIFCCTDNVLSVIFRKFRNLRALIVIDKASKGFRMTDEGFSGLNSITLKRAKEYLHFSKAMEDKVDAMRRKAYIGDLNSMFKHNKVFGTLYMSLQ